MATKLESRDNGGSSEEELNSLTNLNNRASSTQDIDVPSPLGDNDDNTTSVSVYSVSRQSSQRSINQVIQQHLSPPDHDNHIGLTNGQQTPVSDESAAASPTSTTSALPCNSDQTSPPRSWWWWWEIGAALLSIISISAIIGIVISINDTPLESWQFAISPNSLISILTTIGRSAMMIPIAACLSQLKWHHFRTQPRRLSSLQIFDDASRGPWGSVLFIFKVRTRVLVGLFFALITILALGFEPSAQQILEFRPKRIMILEQVPILGKADRYYSKGFNSPQFEVAGSSPSHHALSLESSLLNGAAGTLWQPRFSCPENATDCEWDNFTSLGLCGEFRNITDEKVHSCTCLTCKQGRVPWGIGLSLGCYYGFKYQIDDNPQRGVPMFYSLTVGAQGPHAENPTTASTIFRAVKSTENLGLVVAKVMGGQVHVDEGETANVTDITNTEDLESLPKLPMVELYTIKWSWCAKTFLNVTASPAGIRPGTIESANLKQGLLPSEGWEVLTESATGSQFHVTTTTDSSLMSYLYDLFNTTVYDRIHRESLSDAEKKFDIGSLLYGTDLRNLTGNIAEVLTNQIRSNDPGDNANATVIDGRAWTDKTYIRARWQWIILPLSETILTGVLLVVSIRITKGQGLWKSSTAALLLHKLGGWTEEELNLTWEQTSEQLDAKTERMLATLKRDENGVHGFYKAP